MNAAPVAITWQLSERTGWGMVGVAIAEHLAAEGRPPLLVQPPAPDLPASLRPHLAVMTRFATSARAMLEANAGRPVRLAPSTMLHGFGNGLRTLDHVTDLSGSRNVALAAVEETRAPPERVAHLAAMDRVIVHSHFAVALFEGWGLGNVALVHQGVDPVIFRPRPRRDLFEGRFVVFSGGKLEFRKGQDIALAAFARFHRRHPDTVLVGAWATYWPELAFTMDESSLAAPLGRLADGGPDIAGWAMANGLPEAAFRHFSHYGRPDLAELLSSCDVAIFPNRCEACTNLVAMEAMACAVPCILSANTGHCDLIEGGLALALRDQKPVADADGSRRGWGESSVEELAEALERAYAERAEMRKMAAAGSAFIRRERSWALFASRIMALAED